MTLCSKYNECVWLFGYIAAGGLFLFQGHSGGYLHQISDMPKNREGKQTLRHAQPLVS